jgi:hypothetical protein
MNPITDAVMEPLAIGPGEGLRHRECAGLLSESRNAVESRYQYHRIYSDTSAS